MAVAGVSWRWVFWLLTMFAGSCLVMILLFLPETHAYVEFSPVSSLSDRLFFVQTNSPCPKGTTPPQGNWRDPVVGSSREGEHDLRSAYGAYSCSPFQNPLLRAYASRYHHILQRKLHQASNLRLLTKLLLVRLRMSISNIRSLSNCLHRWPSSQCRNLWSHVRTYLRWRIIRCPWIYLLLESHLRTSGEGVPP